MALDKGISVGTPGQRLMPAVIDELAKTEPDRAWASIPVDDWDLSQGFEDISYGVFANAINELAWLIDKSIGKSSTFETIAYLGAMDIRYHMFQMACCKTGHKALFSSQLNSLSIHMRLMERTECHAVFSAKGVHVEDLLAARMMQSFKVPELDDLLDLGDKVEVFPYTKTFEEARNDPYLILQTSGTTGDPKPIVYNHNFIASQDAQCLIPQGERKQCLDLNRGYGERFMVVTLPFLSMSAGFAMVMSVLGGGVFIPGFRNKAVDLNTLYEFLDHAKVTRAVLTPWMMEDVARQTNAQQYISRFTKVFYGGAVLSDEAASTWAKHTRIQNGWGATETLGPSQLEADPEDYGYVSFDIKHSGLDFRQIKDDGYSENGTPTPIYSMWFTITPDSAPWASWHARNGISLESYTPNEHDFEIGDLWTPHPDPEKADRCWRFVGRVDDLITFSTGVNFHPGPMEKELLSHEQIGAAVVIGNSRKQPLALIELTEGVVKTDVTEINLWQDAIAPLNEQLVPAHGKVSIAHVLVVEAGGFVRTSKGSVVRMQTEKKFKKEIDSVYERLGDEWQDNRERMRSIIATTDITISETSEPA